MALAAYRNLLRATRIAFQGDHQLLHSARSQARAGFDQNSSLDSSSSEATAAVEHAQGVAHLLRHNLVQGELQDSEGKQFKLRIHEDTERGENDTVKNPLGKDGKVKVYTGM